MANAELLVIDDEEEMLVSYEKILSREGYQVYGCPSAEAALGRLGQGTGARLVICDLKMPGMDGMRFLTTVKERHPQLPVIMVTGYGTLETAIEAVKIGACDFIEKPFSNRKLLAAVQKAVAQVAPAAPAGHPGRAAGMDGLVGQHAEMQRVYEVIERVAAGEANVLVTGESGVGKELVARSIHKRSTRRGRPLIPINCGALPEALFESELFGYQKGAFTGAYESKPGLIELANGGTLFLDEVCEMPQALQVKLLRVLEDRRIRPIGGKKEIPVDVRIVTATNRDVHELVASGALREDFFYRINTIQIHIPPLRSRAEDIPLLARHFLREFNQRYGRGVESFESSAIEAMQRYAWPGNVRELHNVVERTYYLANPPVIRRADLPAFLTTCRDRARDESWKELPYQDAKDRALELFEREYLSHNLERYDWNISQAASACGMDRRTMHRLINRYDLRKG